MPIVVTLADFVPPPRFDSLPWTDARIEEAATATGVYTALETIAIAPTDADPSNPASRSFTTQLGTAAEQWYRIVFVDADGDETAPTTPIQNGVISNYATVEELAGILHVNAATRRAALQRVLDAAAFEINQELGLDEAYTSPPALVVEVNLERAVEHWQQMQSPFGIVSLGGESQPAFSATDSWNRHANKLASLKVEYGIA